jgi:hypothetical protein
MNRCAESFETAKDTEDEGRNQAGAIKKTWCYAERRAVFAGPLFATSPKNSALLGVVPYFALRALRARPAFFCLRRLRTLNALVGEAMTNSYPNPGAQRRDLAALVKSTGDLAHFRLRYWLAPAMAWQ